MLCSITIINRLSPYFTGTLKNLLLVFSICLLASGIAKAKENIVILTSSDSPLYEEFISSFKQHADTPTLQNTEVNTVVIGEQNLAVKIEQANLILAVGVHATETAIKLRGKAPILSTLVPRITIEALKNRLKPQGPLFVVYLDQPPDRQLRLIRAILPDADRIGIPLGTFSNHLANEFLFVARSLQLDLLLTQASDDPLAAVIKTLPSCDAILALPDASIYNQSTVRAILLNTFRADVPLFGYSQAFVEAGALAGIYSSPAQIGRHAAELADRILANQQVAANNYPKYFTVKTNRQIAQVLNIKLASDDNLQASVIAGEK